MMHYILFDLTQYSKNLSKDSYSFYIVHYYTVDSGYSELSVIVNYFRGPFKTPYHLNTKNSGYTISLVP